MVASPAVRSLLVTGLLLIGCATTAPQRPPRHPAGARRGDHHVTPPERDEATTACVAAVIPLAARFPRFTGMPQTINYPLFFPSKNVLPSWMSPQ